MQITVICPVYNTPPTLICSAIGSVRDQAGGHSIEIIIVDDCSSIPETAAFLSSLAGVADVRVIHRNVNGGPGQARHLGIAAARYDWVGFIDADDLWPPDKLNRADEVLAKLPDSRWISGNYATLGPDRKLHESLDLTSKIDPLAVEGAVCRLGGLDLTKVLIGDWLPLGASVIRKDLIDQAGGFDATLRYGEDWMLCLLMSTYAAMDYRAGTFYILRRQGGSMMRSPQRMTAQFVQAAKRARQDRRLQTIRRELRWKLYADHKDVAMNCSLNRSWLSGLRFAVQAFLIDPREVGDLGLYLQSALKAGDDRAEILRRYSSAEQVDLSRLEDGPEAPGSMAEHVAR